MVRKFSFLVTCTKASQRPPRQGFATHMFIFNVTYSRMDNHPTHPHTKTRSENTAHTESL